MNTPDVNVGLHCYSFTFCLDTHASCHHLTDVHHTWQGYYCSNVESAARRQPRRTAGRGPPRERRVPPTGAVAEVICEKVPTRVQSRRRRPPYPVPSNGLPSAPAGDTTPRSERKKAPAPLKP
ncbi:unnamed protein product [Pleuronectes platessa]|uniref:Uncharacterized protein n=1 Tax=Pleuronectes platessa TaxID=8262 RepID=A0A9N7VX33_PLEPL|nr:unnamed protein product [Pleuronectes platessa]